MRVLLKKQNIKIKNLLAIVPSIKEPYQKEQKKEQAKKIKIIIKVIPVCLRTQDLKFCMVYNYM